MSADWDLAMKGRIYTVKASMAFVQLCKQLQIPPSYHHVYYKWLLAASNEAVTAKHIGPWAKRGARVRIGTTLPAPTGAAWHAMLPSLEKKLKDCTDSSSMEQKHATIIGAMVARCLDSDNRNEAKITEDFNVQVTIIEANKTRVRATDNVENIVAPPKGIRGLYGIPDKKRRDKFIAAMAKEPSALTEMGTISQHHSAKELLERYKIDIQTTPAVPTMLVFENKFENGNVTAEQAAAKARMRVESTKRVMFKGVHYDSVYAATPGQDSIMFYSALVVHLKLLRRAFDVGNAYGWAPQNKKLALDYPRGLDQFNEEGERLYMCLH